MKIPGRFLVRGGGEPCHSPSLSLPLLKSNVALSFWGGIHPRTGIVTDATHPLAGVCVSNAILCVPSARGSCTASQVLLELILEEQAPRAIVFRDADSMACVGAIIARELFDKQTIQILVVGQEGFQQIMESNETSASILADGSLVLGETSNDETVDEIPLADDKVQFTDTEMELLTRCTTQAETMALRVIFQYAHLSSDTPSYIPIQNAHIDGCTYIGPGGLAFARRLLQAGGHVRVPTTLNAISTDMHNWAALGVDAEYATNAMALAHAYEQLGCQPSFTCAPYLLNSAPTPNQNVCWGESNAVVYANSVLGARTEKYADYLDICCAIAGIVPAVGVHVERRPRVVLDATHVLHTVLLHDDDQDVDMLFPILGHVCGALSDGKIAILLGLESWTVTKDHLKSFCAAFGTTGSSPLIHIAGITPEAKEQSVIDAFVTDCGDNRRVIDEKDLMDTFRTLDSDDSQVETVKLIALGNPHLSISECETLCSLVRLIGDKTTKHPDIRIMACLSRTIHAEARQLGFIEPLERFGVEFVNDTCWCMLLDEPVIPTDPNARILSNSGKYAHYGPGLTGRKFRFGSLSDCVQSATTGVYPRRLTPSEGSGMQRLYARQARRELSTTILRFARKLFRK
jgi:predicted aconitase/predicted aconitase with swiveling domain